MSDERRQTFFPDLDESVCAFDVAAAAEDFVDEIAKGHPTGETLIALCSALYELKLVARSGLDLSLRAEELREDLKRNENEHPELLNYSNYFIEFESDDRDHGVVRKYPLEESAA